MVLHIGRLSASDWRRLRDIRLRALADSPDAFASAHAAEAAFTEADWRRLANEQVFVAVGGARDVGMAACSARQRSAVLWGMWVDPSVRRRGVGRALLEEGIAWARGAGFPAITLWVAVGNEGALALYRSRGFRVTGAEHPLPGRHVTEAELSMNLSRSHPTGPEGAGTSIPLDTPRRNEDDELGGDHAVPG